jgi:hypothetical protein
MVDIRRRVEKLERVVALDQPIGTHSLKITVREGEGCDVALQREIEAKGISVKDVGFIELIGDLSVDYKRDLQNHPDWEILDSLNKAQRIYMLYVVKSKSEWQEYLKRNV